MAIGKAIGVGLNVANAVQPVMDIYGARKEGNSWGASIGKGLISYATFELFPGVGWGFMAKDLAEVGIQGLKKVSDHAGAEAAQTYKRGFGGNFIDTQASYTMRQRGLQAIQNNGINARSLLGNEARMHSRGRYE